jgi:hypothetical protein
MSPLELSLTAGLVDESVPGLGLSAPGKPPRSGKPTLTLGISPDCPALDCDPAVALEEPASPLEPEGIEGDCEDERDDDEEEDCEDEGIDGLLLELLGGDGLLGELLDALEGLLGEGIDADDDELWLCD